MKFQSVEHGVVVPWDFSDLARQALQQTFEMVDEPALIRVIHVTEYPSAYEFGMVGPMATDDQIVKRVNELFRQMVHDDGVPSELSFAVKFGNPGSQICQFAKELSADLIVMPSHGRSGFAKLLLGSVAERVVRMAPCPVLILRHDAIDQQSVGKASAVAGIPR